MLYPSNKSPEWRFETYAARSRDLKTWELASRNPILAPGEGEDINTSGPDLVEFEDKIYLYYSISDQRAYSKLKHAVFEGTFRDFFHWCFR